LILCAGKIALFCKTLAVGWPVARPKKSLHFLLVNPVTNLHIYFNPKYCLLFLTPSLFRFARKFTLLTDAIGFSGFEE